MRSLAAILLVSVAGCSVPSYSLRASSSTPLYASNDVVVAPSPAPSPGMVEVPASDVARRPIVLVPAVRRGHSITWKTGAAITVCSFAVTLAGLGLTLGGLQGVSLDGPSHNNGDMFLAGIIVSAIGDGGLFLGGPITWIAGIGGARD